MFHCRNSRRRPRWGRSARVHRRQAEPLDWLGQRLGASGHHAGQGRRHLRAEGKLSPAAVGEVEELGDDFVAALDPVQIEMLEGRAVVFDESVAQGDAPPAVGDPVAQGPSPRGRSRAYL